MIHSPGSKLTQMYQPMTGQNKERPQRAGPFPVLPTS